MEAFLRQDRGALPASPPPVQHLRASGDSSARDRDVGGTHRFTRARRVRRRIEYQQVFERGSRLHTRFFTILVWPNGGPSTRLGMVASRKFGGAVQRNRAKRLIREVFRRHVQPNREPALDVIVIPKREMLQASVTDLAEDFRTGLRRAVERLEKHGRR